MNSYNNEKLYAYYEIEDVNMIASNASLFNIAYETRNVNARL